MRDFERYLSSQETEVGLSKHPQDPHDCISSHGVSAMTPHWLLKYCISIALFTPVSYICYWIRGLHDYHILSWLTFATILCVSSWLYIANSLEPNPIYSEVYV